MGVGKHGVMAGMGKGHLLPWSDEKWKMRSFWDVFTFIAIE